MDEIVFIFVARLVPEKGIKELLEAFTEIVSTSKSKLIIVGNKLYGENIEDPFLLDLKEIACKKKEDIIFTGFMPPERLSSFYSIADVGILPSIYDEPFSLSALEYMASGLAIVVSDAGGFPEMVGDNGIIVKRDNLKDNLSKVMQSFIDNPAQITYLSEKSIGRSKEFSVTKYIHEQNELFNYLIKGE